MKLLILAGGEGTRLGLDNTPKPMAEVAGKPIIEHQIELAKRYGLTDIYILSGYMAHVISDYLGDGSKFGVNITHIVEDEPLGTSGSVKQMKDIMDERFFVFYGDVIMDVNLEKMMEFDKSHMAVATIATHPNDHPYDSDLIECDSEGLIEKFLSKPHEGSVYRNNLVSAALYILSPEIFDYIPKGKSDFGKDIFPALLDAGEKIVAHKTTEYLKDMGTPERLEKVSKDVLSGKIARRNISNKQKAIFLDRDGVINTQVHNISNIENFELIDRVSEAIVKINRSDYLTVVVTNQPAVAKGFMSEDELNEIHKKMDTLLGKNGAFIDHTYYCPHHPDSGFDGEIKELKIVCECRKPSPGMLLEAADRFNIELKESWMIGDHERDLTAGKNAGCKTIYINEGSSEHADEVFKTLYEAVEFILQS